MKNGRPMAVNYKTKDAVSYQSQFRDYVKDEIKKQGWETNLNNPRHFYVDAVFYMDKKRRDPNNHWKCLLDAITETEMLWDDDDIVCERVNKILYDTQSPRVELDIYYVDYVGIFENEIQLDEFISSNCIDCKRYKRNCSILRNAIEGRIQEHICGLECTKYSHDNKCKVDTEKVSIEEILG